MIFCKWFRGISLRTHLYRCGLFNGIALLRVKDVVCVHWSGDSFWLELEGTREYGTKVTENDYQMTLSWIVSVVLDRCRVESY